MTQTKPEISTSLAVLFAVAAGLAVGNLYWAQPLLTAIANEFNVRGWLKSIVSLFYFSIRTFVISLEQKFSDTFFSKYLFE